MTKKLFTKKLTRLEILLLLATLMLRMSWIIAHPLSKPDRIYLPDSYQYVLIANNLIHHKVFSLNKNPPFKPDNARTPVYPLFIAGIILAFGSNPLNICFVQAILSVLLVFITVRLGTLIYSKSAGIIGGFFLGVAPFQTIFAGYLMAEILFTVLFSLFVLALLNALKRPSCFAKFFFSGFLLGVSTLCRPISLYLLVPIAAFWPLIQSQKKAQSLFVLFLGFAIVIGPWMLRNRLMTGFFGISTISKNNILDWDIPSFGNYLTGDSIATVQKQYGKLNMLSPLEKYWDLVKKNPISYIKIRLIWLYRLLFDPGEGVLVFLNHPTVVGPEMEANASPFIIIRQDLISLHSYLSQYLKKHTPVKGFILSGFILYYLCFLLIRLVFAAIGSFWLFKSNQSASIFIWLIIGYFIAVIGSVGSGRFMIPLEPILSILAGITIIKIFGSRFSLKTSNDISALFSTKIGPGPADGDPL